MNLSLIDWFKITSDVNYVDALIDVSEEMYGNMKCMDLWQTEIYIFGLGTFTFAHNYTVSLQLAQHMLTKNKDARPPLIAN